MKYLTGKKILKLAVLATLLAGGTVWAIPSPGGETGYTVNYHNNTGTEQNPYTKITIDKDSVNNISYLLNVYKNVSTYTPIYVQQGILLDKDEATTQTTYLGTDTTISVNSTGLNVSNSGYELNSNIGAVGIMNYGTSNANVLTVSAAGPITINAQVEAGTGTGTDYVNKGALAVGVLNTNGKENSNNYASGVININQPLTITATAKGGTAISSKHSQGTDICAGAQAWAYGLYNYAGTGTITVGPVDITASAQGGSAADPYSAGNVASASAYGAYNDGGKLNIGTEGTTSTFAATATGGTVVDGSHGYSNATAYGLGFAGNLYKGLNIKGNVHITKVKAVAGSANDAADSSIADATGMSDVYSITGNVEIDEVSAETLSSNIAVANAPKNAKATGYTPYGGGSSVGGNLHIGTVKAVAGTALGKGANVNADATGVEFRGNKAGGTFTVDKVLAQAGTAADAGSAVARAKGMAVLWTSTGAYKQITLTNVKAVAGTGKAAFADAVGLGFYTSSTSSCTVAGLTANVKATGPSNASDDPYASAHGFENDASEIKLIGDTALTATITNSNAAQKNEAAAVYTYAANGVTDINTTDGTTSLGKKVQLTGDVIACDSGKNNIILDGSTSYLMGNILNATPIKTTIGTNNLTFTNGAAWQPVFDNRNGSFINGTDTTTYSLTNKVNDITTAANLTLSNAGKIDLTWDDATRDPNETKRTMTIASLAGDAGVLVVNSNIQQNIADEFIVTNNTATNIGIDVAYDPALAVSGLDNDSSITGKARVLTINGGYIIPTVTGVADSYNGYDYTPTIKTAKDGKYYVTKLNITNIAPAPGNETGHTVNFYNNTGTVQDPYTAITIDKDSVNSISYPLDIYKNMSNYVPVYVQQGILLDKDTETTQTTYLGSNAAISVNSTGLDELGSVYELKNIGAAGIMNYGTSADNVLTVTATGPITINAQVQAGDGNSSDLVKKGAFAAGVLNTNGKAWGTYPLAGGTITINQPLTITATATGGNAVSTQVTTSSSNDSIGADAGASAAGLYNNYGTGTINVGQVNVTATAQGGSAADAHSFRNVANATAYGASNDGGKLNIGTEDTTSTFAATATGGSVQAGTGTSDSSSAFAYGIDDKGEAGKEGINIKGNVHITEVKAVSGAAHDAALYSQADAEGIDYVASITGNVDIDEVSAKTISSDVNIKNALKDAGATGMKATDANTTIGGNIHIGTVKAAGGTALGESSNVSANATGLALAGSIVSGTITVDTVLAQGGTANQGSATAIASGMMIETYTNMLAYKQITLTNISAVAGSGQDNAYAEATGIRVDGNKTCTIAGLTANVQAAGPSNASDDPYASAIGLNNNNVLTKLTGDTVLTAAVTNPNAVKGNEAAAVYTYGTDFVTDINTEDGATSLGKKVQLTGDVVARSGGKNNIILGGAASYLQGNILNATAMESETGTNNLTFTKGAAWQPVFDNRNGSFINGDDTTTYSLTNKVNDITTAANLTLSNAGKIDLTWDDATRDPNETKRTMTIASLAGDGGVLVVNSNIQQNIADEFIVTNNSAANLGIDVAYDPALAVNGLDNDSSITGKARVLTINGGATTPAVAGVADSYNGYDYMPTVTTDKDGKYYVTKLAITNVEPTPTPTPTPDPTPTPTPDPTPTPTPDPTPTPTPDPTPTPTPEPTPDSRQTLTAPSRPMREARHERMAMHNLWVNAELNNLQKRLGDLRALEPAAAGIWARYEHNKLEKGADNSLKYNYFQLGYDKDFKGDTGTFYRGAAFSYGKGTGEYEIGSGDLKEGALSLYQTWIGKNGSYYDVIAKLGKLFTSYDVTNTANPYTSDYNTWSYSLGAEIGKRIRKDNGFFVEPQLEFTLSRINSADYTTSTGMNIYAEAQNSAIFRAGIVVGRELKNTGSYYFKASCYHDFGGGTTLIASDSTFYPYSYSEEAAKNWCIFTLGGTAKVGKNYTVFGELSKYTGQLTNNVQVNVGARLSF